MEHVYLASGGKLTEFDRVPYCASTDYLGVPFLEYLERSGSSRSWWCLPEVRGEDANALYQTWLFFCLLQEILGPHFRQEDYIRPETISDGSEALVITTASLLKTLTRWAEETLSDSSRPDRYDHLKYCLLKTELPCIFLGRINEASSRSVRTMAGAASVAIARAYGQDMFAVGFEDNLPTKQDLDMMSAAGWCPYNARKTWQACFLIESQMLLRSLRKHPAEWQDHSDCESNRCLCATIDPQRFVPRHVLSDCDCHRSISVDNEKLEQILQGGDVAVIEVELDSGGPEQSIQCVSLVGSRTVKGYIAISHVWADGLANPFQNSLPICQFTSLLAKVVGLKKKIAAESSAHTTSPLPKVHFWLDVLCVPIGPPQLKSLGMQLMKDTYRNASHCLVIDSTLDRVNVTNLNPVEIAAHIISSTWIGRLWTLQEAILPPELWFRFADDYLSLYGIVAALTGVLKQYCMNQSISALDFAMILHSLYGLKRSTALKVTLWDVAHAVAKRSVSTASDEPLCLSTLIGEDLPFIEEFEGQNMARFWAQCGEKDLVGTSIIFHEDTKLDVEGFRWAPRTLLIRSDIDFKAWGGTLVPDKATPATIEPRGLRVMYGGLSAKPGIPGQSCHQVLVAADEDFAFRFLLIRDKEAETWLTCELAWPQSQRDLQGGVCERSNFALILQNILTDGPPRNGIVCDITDADHDRIFVRTIGPCNVRRNSQRHSTLLNALLSDGLTRTVEGLLSELEELGPFDTTMRWHGLAVKKQKADPRLLQRYASMLLSRITNGEYLEIKQHYGKEQVWIVD